MDKVEKQLKRDRKANGRHFGRKQPPVQKQTICKALIDRSQEQNTDSVTAPLLQYEIRVLAGDYMWEVGLFAPDADRVKFKVQKIHVYRDTAWQLLPLSIRDSSPVKMMLKRLQQQHKEKLKKLDGEHWSKLLAGVAFPCQSAGCPATWQSCWVESFIMWCVATASVRHKSMASKDSIMHRFRHPAPYFFCLPRTPSE